MKNFDEIRNEINKRIQDEWSPQMSQATEWLNLRTEGQSSATGVTITGLLAQSAPQIPSEKEVLRALYHEPVLSLTFGTKTLETSHSIKAKICIETLFNHTVELECSGIEVLLMPRMPYCMHNYLSKTDFESRTSGFTPIHVQVTRIHNLTNENIPIGHPLKTLRNVKLGMGYLLEKHYKNNIHEYTKYFGELKSSVSCYKGALTGS
jgi:hypothetical protein